MKPIVRVLDPQLSQIQSNLSQLIKKINYAIKSELNKHYTITNHMNTKNDDLGKLLKLWFQSKNLGRTTHKKLSMTVAVKDHTQDK